MTQYVLWKGDITELKVEAIVNASNESGLGCHIPDHCIDSAIHHKAGPELLEECRKFHGIPTGVAKITQGYHLPCQFIIHVTGPRAEKDKPLDFVMLEKSYTACLDVAAANNIKELAFCCLSTGIFGFPKKESAQVAINAIRSWNNKYPNKCNKIIFNVFTWEDAAIYGELLA